MPVSAFGEGTTCAHITNLDNATSINGNNNNNNIRSGEINIFFCKVLKAYTLCVYVYSHAMPILLRVKPSTWRTPPTNSIEKSSGSVVSTYAHTKRNELTRRREKENSGQYKRIPCSHNTFYNVHLNTYPLTRVWNISWTVFFSLFISTNPYFLALRLCPVHLSNDVCASTLDVFASIICWFFEWLRGVARILVVVAAFVDIIIQFRCIKVFLLYPSHIEYTGWSDEGQIRNRKLTNVLLMKGLVSVATG